LEVPRPESGRWQWICPVRRLELVERGGGARRRATAVAWKERGKGKGDALVGRDDSRKTKTASKVF
jgi:hypothetical protein